MVPRQHSAQTRRSALADHASGLQAPIICQRHGISERTLARWIRDQRASPLGAAPVPVRDERQRTLCRDALCVVLGMLSVPERRRALHLVESRLHLTRGRGTALLLGREPCEVRSVPSGAAAIVGLPVSRPCLDFTVAPTIGAARWLVVRAPLGRFEFVQATAETMLPALRSCGCMDVICAEMEEATAAEWSAAGVRLWRAAGNGTLRRQLALFDGRVLRRWRPGRSLAAARLE